MVGDFARLTGKAERGSIEKRQLGRGALRGSRPQRERLIKVEVFHSFGVLEFD